jgi:sRNA-binding protein
MQVNDGGTASFFAVLKKSSADQKARIEKKAEEKKAEKKEAEKKAEKKEKEERLEKAREADDDTAVDDEDTVIITANSIEELIQKINDYSMEERSNNVLTDYEKTIGQNIDFRG